MRQFRNVRRIRTLGDVKQATREMSGGSGGYGLYGQGDPNTWPQEPRYDDQPVYNPPAIGLENVWQNLNGAILTPFDVANTSVSIITANARRNGLIIQNQSAAGSNLYVNFGNLASVASGLRIASGVTLLLDFWVPRDDIQVFYDNAAVQHGIIVEGTMQAPLA